MFSLATKFASFISAILRQRQGALILGVSCSEGLDCCNAPAEFNFIFFPFFFHESSQTEGKKRKTQNAFSISKHPPFCGGKFLLENVPSR
jgi:hypothetical protein